MAREMIPLDNDILVTQGSTNPDPHVVSHRQYSRDWGGRV